MKKIFGFLLVLSVWSSCVDSPEYPDEPVLTFVSFAKDTVRQSLDTNVITIAFTDGDGDLGAMETDTFFNLFLRDITLGVVFPYRIPFIPKQGIGNGISGEIELTLLPTDICCDSVPLPCFKHPGAADETISYEVEVEDRAGNRSAPLKLPPIRMRCDY